MRLFRKGEVFPHVVLIDLVILIRSSSNSETGGSEKFRRKLAKNIARQRDVQHVTANCPNY